MYCRLGICGGWVPVIPKQLQLKNFLSYREATLDFDGIHVACIAGPNGAGKSSLLEAMAWAIALVFVLSFTVVFIAGARYIARHRH
mgnify:CR=1 FL=1